MNKFLKNKLSNYFNTSKTPDLCMKYLKLNYPLHTLKYDHMAFRSIKHTDFEKLSNVIIESGFEKVENISIPCRRKTDMNKYAVWFKNEQFEVPRIFLSRCYTTMYHDGIMDSEYKLKRKIRKLNKLGDDYIPWTFLFADEINHLAIDMSEYENFEETIEQMAKDLDLEMNDQNGLFQVSKDGNLIQCSTKADLHKGYPKNYIEFVKRIDGREGFEGDNAYSIFKSTEK